MTKACIKTCAISLLLAGLMSACSAPSDDARGNAAPGGTSSQPLPQNGTAQPTSAAAPPPAAPAPAEVPARPAQPVSNGPAPKLVVPVTKLDFGRQAQDKTLVRSFVIRNTGKAELKIESVEPS